MAASPRPRPLDSIGWQRNPRAQQTEPTEPATPATEPAEPLTPEQIDELVEAAIADGRIPADHADAWRKVLAVDPLMADYLQNLPPGQHNDDQPTTNLANFMGWE